MWLRHLVHILGSLVILLLGHAFRFAVASYVETNGLRIPKVAELATDYHDNLAPASSLFPLNRRVALPPYLLSTDWIVDHHDFTCLLPIASAAAELQDFYESIAAFAASTLRTPSNYYRMVVGDITLEVICPAANVINWIIVQTFANQMLEMTKRGYSNSYQINFVNRSTGRLLTFNLYVAYMRAAADGQP